MSQKSRYASRIAATLIAGGLVVGTAGCSSISNLFSGSSEQRNDTGEIVEGGTTDVFTLAVGDCLTDTGSGVEVSEVPTVPCADPHAYEVYSELTLDAGDYPGDDVVSQKAEEGCAAAFEPFVGLAYDSSTLDYTYYTPTETTWTQIDDRLVSCLISDTANAETTGSLKGSAR